MNSDAENTARLVPLEILIVEDDDDARASLQDILDLHQHRVTSKRNASEAIALASELSAFDVILLDRNLPDGMIEDLLPRFRSFAPRADYIVVTGFTDLDATLSALRQGVSDYIIKPVNPTALLANLERIGSRRRIERELQNEREFAEKVLETAEAIILVLDTDGRIIRFNHHLTELTGLTLNEVSGLDWFETFVPAKQRDRIRYVFQETLNDHVTRGIVNPVRTKDGVDKEIRWSNSAFRDSQGNLSGVLAIGLDVTDLINAQKKILQSERLAAIGETVAGLAHESRNALQRLQNAVELLEDDLKGNESALNYLKKIARAGNHLRDLLEEVRGYAAPIKLDLSRTSIAVVWRRAWASLETKREEYHAKLQETIPEGVDLELQIDIRRMEQVFRNLFENSFDAAGRDAKISITLEADHDWVKVRIKDNGSGIDADDSRVFDAFVTSKPTGTGLGLAIVKRIVESHQGTIELGDQAEGAEFLLCLPRNFTATARVEASND